MSKSKALSQWMEKVGSEVCDAASLGADGTVRVQTNDEALARLLWKQALGYVVTEKHNDGTEVHRVYPPDSRSQTTILERREGKPVTSDGVDGDLPTILDKVSDMVVKKLNAEVDSDDRTD